MATGSHVQKLYVMWHGQRLDNAHQDLAQEPEVRTWELPLTNAGVEQARSGGENIRSEEVCIEFGLSELMNSRAIWYPLANPRNGEVWTSPLDRLVSELPSGVVGLLVQPVMPKVRESLQKEANAPFTLEDMGVQTLVDCYQYMVWASTLPHLPPATSLCNQVTPSFCATRSLGSPQLQIL